jgi:hypothetical protein
MAQKLNRIELSSGWKFKQTDATGDDIWSTVAKVPSVVHLDLLEHKKHVEENTIT